MIIGGPFPVMRTKNLVLRKMTLEDRYDLFQMRRDPAMHQYTDSRPDESIDDTEAYIHKMLNGIAEGKWIVWAVEHPSAKKVIGTVSIWNIDEEHRLAELGYGIAPDFQGRGLMKEALLKVVDFGFSVMKLKTLNAYTEESNFSSGKLLESCKFRIADRVKEQGYCNDRIYHMLVYRLEHTVP